MTDDDEPKVVWGIWPWSNLVTKSSTGTPEKRRKRIAAERRAEEEEWASKSGPVTTRHRRS